MNMSLESDPSQRAVTRATSCGVQLIIRPPEDIQSIEQYALDVAGGDPVRAGFLLRYAQYQACGADLWGNSLHVMEQDEDVDEKGFEFNAILDSIESAPQPTDIYFLAKVADNADKLSGICPWDTELYIAELADLFGDEFVYERFQELATSESFQKIKDFYAKTVGVSVWEWDTELIVTYMQHLLVYYIADSEHESEDEPSVFRSRTSRVMFGSTVKTLVGIVQFEYGNDWENALDPALREYFSPEMISQLASWADEQAEDEI